MTDRAREGVFSSLASHIPGADVLDLFAGSGSLGLEALSRGAASVVFVEHAKEAVDVITSNMEAVGLGGTVRHQSVERFLDAGGAASFDLVFVDPPYAASLASVEAILRSLLARVRPGGQVTLHRERGESPPDVPGLALVWERSYGTAQVWRFEKEDG